MRSLRSSLLVLFLLLTTATAMAQSEVAAGTRFMVELRDTLDATRIQAGKGFEARTIEPLPLIDGGYIPAGAKLKGRVSSVSDNKMMLRFERIETGRGKIPILATVVGVPGEKHVKNETGDEGEIRASGGRGKPAGIGALIGAGVGAAIGAKAGGGKAAAIGAGAGAGTGALIGAAAGGKDLVLQKGARLEVQLDRPLILARYYR